MAGLLQIRDVPDATRRVLKARAALRGESLNRYLLRLIEAEAQTPTLEEVFEGVIARGATSVLSGPEIAELIREGHDERDRDIDQALRH